MFLYNELARFFSQDITILDTTKSCQLDINLLYCLLTYFVRACVFKLEILFDQFYILLFGLMKCVSAPKHMQPQQDSFTAYIMNYI